ncbi:hypothetical protein Bca52824_022554 [Brassica carinata]|uniref:Uncharacterized protein n=1 Tax=Brassica carinata TaxID=52824 RepID=A0A8X7VGV6_BRACI|nr:hypothetical protein Bca52824_022554 [Brassica carinata]
MVFHVSPFGPSCCDIQYTAPNVPAATHGTTVSVLRLFLWAKRARIGRLTTSKVEEVRHDNKCRIGDLFAINVVGDGMSSPLLCVYAPTKEIPEVDMHVQQLDQFVKKSNEDRSKIN